jgi:hypothetical protein
MSVLLIVLVAVPAILDLTVAFDPNGPEPTLLNIIQGKKFRAEMFARLASVNNLFFKPSVTYICTFCMSTSCTVVYS